MTKKKLFTLIHGDQLHIAPQTKVIPADEFSTLLDAENVLKQVQKDAELYKKEVVQETEILKEKALWEGYEQGFQEWVGRISALEAEIGNVRKDIEKLIIPVALKAAKKIVSKELELSESAIVEIVAANLKAVSQHKQIVIYVNKKDLEAVEAQRPRLKQMFELLETLSIRERKDIEPGGCIIETEAGIINAQIENRWRILETAFAKMMKTEG